MLINWTDVTDLEIANAAWAVLQMVAKPRTSRRTVSDLDTAAWADTGRLIRDPLAGIGTNFELPDLSDEEAAQLEAALKLDEVQGALQTLLACRLTDASEVDAAKARMAVRLALGGTTSSVTELPPPRSADDLWDEGADDPTDYAREYMQARFTWYCTTLSEYFDEKISALVATLEGRIGLAGLAQVRTEAYDSRIVALLGTIADMLAALSHSDHGGPKEAEFLRRYRRQVRERHGKLEPPDFQRRRKVPVEKIYIDTPIHEYRERTIDLESGTSGPANFNVMDLIGLLDRTVLLGDPGGGKTTAANVLAATFASDPAGKVPFLVTLRDYAAKDPPERSVAGHIEYTLDTLYQCPASTGLVERLLLTGRAVVIFDGLDELLDTSRRSDVSGRVEQFCSAYPLTQMLVTSRLVGYDQARLDDYQFTCYRLGDFSHDQVTEYAYKWFAAQEDFTAAEADAEARAFLAESARALDIRSNPLLLSLMCILYRGAGSLPRDRAEVYEQCANLLFRKWDARRRIHQELRGGHLVEPAIRYLAWWLFNGESPQAAVTERQLVGETTRFLHGRGFESEEEAKTAAQEFVEFCRDRMWVLNEAGTAANGEKLYAFTHRTFLEYFTAAYLAAKFDSPEELARQLATHLQNPGWNVVGELAVQIKDRSNDRGADRFYEALLTDPQEFLLLFLIRCLESVQPSPDTIRTLTRTVIDYLVDKHARPEDGHTLGALLGGTGGRYEAVARELREQISAMIAADDPAIRRCGLRIFLMSRLLYIPSSDFWRRWYQEQASLYVTEILSEARNDRVLLGLALYCGGIDISSVLAMPGAFDALMQTGTNYAIIGGPIAWLPSYPQAICEGLLSEERNPFQVSHLRAIGCHLRSSLKTPMVHFKQPWAMALPNFFELLRKQEKFPILDEATCLGFAVVVCVSDELARPYHSEGRIAQPADKTSAAGLLYQYLARRREQGSDGLPDLPVPAEFRQLFRDWAEGQVSFVEFV